MSGEGRPEEQRLDGTGLTVAIVHGTWHARIADGLLAGARRTLEAAGATVVEHPVPGSFEQDMPAIAQWFAEHPPGHAEG